MTQHLLLKSFTSGGQAHDVGTINVFVGPNNSGKSESLRDLARLAGNFEPTGAERARGEDPRTRVLQDVTLVAKLTVDRLLQGITTLHTGTSEGQIAFGLAPNLRSPFRRPIAADLKTILFRPVLTARSIWMTSLGELMPLRVTYVPAESRGELVASAPAVSPLQAPEHLLAAFAFAPADVHEKFHRAMASLFPGKHVFLDQTERVQLMLRVAAEPPQFTGEPIPDAQLAAQFPPLTAAGEGMISCAAMVLSVLMSPGRVLLFDQPDLGLQPEVSRRLAAWIAENAAGQGCQVFLATRDPAFLAGLFQGGTDVLIWRLLRKDDTTRFELVPLECGRAFATFPLFAAQQALGLLFRAGVVVTPTGADAVIYQAVAERLLRVHNLGFLQAHGTRNLTFVTKALRRANLPVCVVAELDVFQSESSFSEMVKSLSNQAPPAPWLATRERLVSHVEGWFDEQELSATSHEVESFLDQMKQGPGTAEVKAVTTTSTPQKAKWDRLRRERLAIRPPELRIWVEELLEDLKRIGLFLSPKGRLEGWISFAADSEDPDGWLNRAMQMIHGGDAPADLRAFVAEMAAHLQSSPAPNSATGSRSARLGNGT